MIDDFIAKDIIYYMKETHRSWWTMTILLTVYIYYKSYTECTVSDYISTAAALSICFLIFYLLMDWAKKVSRYEYLKRNILPTVIIASCLDYLILHLCAESLLSGTTLWFARYTVCMAMAYYIEGALFYACVRISNKIEFKKHNKINAKITETTEKNFYISD